MVMLYQLLKLWAGKDYKKVNSVGNSSFLFKVLVSIFSLKQFFSQSFLKYLCFLILMSGGLLHVLSTESYHKQIYPFD